MLLEVFNIEWKSRRDDYDPINMVWGRDIGYYVFEIQEDYKPIVVVRSENKETFIFESMRELNALYDGREVARFANGEILLKAEEIKRLFSEETDEELLQKVKDWLEEKELEKTRAIAKDFARASKKAGKEK